MKNWILVFISIFLGYYALTDMNDAVVYVAEFVKTSGLGNFATAIILTAKAVMLTFMIMTVWVINLVFIITKVGIQIEEKSQLLERG